MTDARQLLEDYARNGSEIAFRELAARYLDLVYSTALRLVNGDAHRAQDVAQTVFLDLSREAAKMSGAILVGGWLHRHTCFVAAKMMRAERRRQHRERQAGELNAMNRSDPGLGELLPVLDAAINELEEEDRKAILLRFYEQYDLRSVGKALGSSENAAQKRVSRALDQLHLRLTRQGICLSAAALGAVLAGQAVTAAPACLRSALMGWVFAGGVAAPVVPVAVSKTVTFAKLSAAFCILFAGVAITTIVQQKSISKLRSANTALKAQLNGMANLAQENQGRSNLLIQARRPELSMEEPSREILRLRGEIGLLRRELSTRNAQSSLAARTTNDPTAPNPIPLYTRIMKVDADRLLSLTSNASPLEDQNADQPIPFQKAVWQFLNANGFEIRSPEALFLNEREGTLLLRTSLSNLDNIETLLANLGVVRRTQDNDAGVFQAK